MSHWEATGQSDEWYTPQYVFDALDCVFDLDVAAAPSGANVPARRFERRDGLAAVWRGFVWMNPPFGGRNGLEPWLNKFISHGNGIALTPDRTSAPWFQHWAPRAQLMLFMPKVRFIRPDGTEGKSPSTGTVLWGVGRQAEKVLNRARSLGIVLRPT